MNTYTEKKTGLIMEGGAMRGLFTGGIIDVLMEQGIDFDGAIGVSAGAAFGCNYKSKQIGRPLRYNKKYCADKRYGNFHSFFKTGDIFDTQFCYHDIPCLLDPFDTQTFQKNPMEFYVVCTDVPTGKAVYHRCTTGLGDDLIWFQASASMPVVSNIVTIGDRQLLDGGIADSIPIRYFEHLGYHHNVVILTQPLDYQKEPNKFLPLIRLKYRNYPQLIQAVAHRHIRYNQTTAYLKQQEQAGKVFVLRPPAPLNISSTEKRPEELERVYQIGRTTAEAHLEALKHYLA